MPASLMKTVSALAGAESHLANGASTVIGANQMSIRYLSFSDPARAKRHEWLAQVFEGFETFDYAENATRFLSIAQDDFDGLFVGCNDIRRATRLLKLNMALLRGRMKIVLLTDSTPSRRAQIVSGGFDDAIDIERISPHEGIARIRAIWARYQASMLRERKKADLVAQIDSLCDDRVLTLREEAVLTTLLEGMGRPVSLRTLANSISATHEPASVNSLRVLISGLRRKLRQNVSIVSNSGQGYLLAIADAEG